MHLPLRIRCRIACVLVIAAAAGFVPIALASPTQVIADFNDDGFLQEHHSWGDLRTAPLLMQRIDPPRAAALLRVANEKIAHDFLGIEPPVESNGTAASPPVGDLPTWVVGGAIGAGLLVLGGTASAIYRRMRQDPLP